MENTNQDVMADSSAANPQGSDTPTITQDSDTSNDTQGGDKPTKGPIPFERFEEVNNERKALLEEVEKAKQDAQGRAQLEQTVQDLQKKFDSIQQALTPKEQAEIDGLSPEELQQLSDYLPPSALKVVEKYIFTRAAQVAEQEQARTKAEREKIQKQREAEEAEVQQMVDQIREDLGSEEAIGEFQKWATDYHQKHPSFNLGQLYEIYQENKPKTPVVPTTPGNAEPVLTPQPKKGVSDLVSIADSLSDKYGLD